MQIVPADQSESEKSLSDDVRFNCEEIESDYKTSTVCPLKRLPGAEGILTIIIHKLS